MGRTAIYLVMGLNILFLSFGLQMHDVKFVSMGNAMKYYENTQRMNMAQAGANLALSIIFKDSTWKTGFTDISFNGGTFSVNVKDTLTSKFGLVRKVFVTGKYEAGSVDEITGKALDSVRNITIYMRPSSFSQFAYFSANDPEGIYWTSSDTVWGPYHSNTYLYVDGRPVFNGKVTVKYDVDTIGAKGKDIGNPQFNYGFEKGVNIPLPGEADLTKLKDSAIAKGKLYSTKLATKKNDTAWITLKSDSITIKTKYEPGTTKTFRITDSISNGILTMEGYVVRLSGVLQGRLSIVSLPKKYSSTPYGGNIFIDNDITYKTNPMTDPTSNDLLGILAENDIMIADNSANSSGDINIHGALFSRTGGFGSENYATRDKAGAIKLIGGMTQKERQPVGTFNSGSSTISSGFSKSYRYDERLKFMSPPAFPMTKMFQIISWYE